jgi:hypothetical protein
MFLNLLSENEFNYIPWQSLIHKYTSSVDDVQFKDQSLSNTVTEWLMHRAQITTSFTSSRRGFEPSARTYMYLRD